jgi:hypothetical protein
MNSRPDDEVLPIVVGVDGSESSNAALRWAIHQAKLTGAVVEAVTAWQIPVGTGLVPPADMPDYQDDARMVLTEAITGMCMIDARGRGPPAGGGRTGGAGAVGRGRRGGTARAGQPGSRRTDRGAAWFCRPVLRAPRAVPRRYHARQVLTSTRCAAPTCLRPDGAPLPSRRAGGLAG